MRRKSTPDYNILMELINYNYDRIGTLSYRNLLDNVCPGCYVESSSTKQGGIVEKIIRNKDGIPVCLKIRYDETNIDYISVDRVSFWEPFDSWVPNSNYDRDFEEYFGDDEDFEEE